MKPCPSVKLRTLLTLNLFIYLGPPIMPLDQNPHQTVTRFGCVAFSIYACGFSVPQMRKCSLFAYPPKSKRTSSEKMIFAKIAFFCKSIAGNISQLFSSVYTSIFVLRKDKTNCLSNQA